MTPTGRERVGVLLGDSVENCYVPYDLPGSLARFLRHNNPNLLVMIDTELWPNTLAACEAHGVSKVLVNGRLSSRSAAGYERIASLAVPMIRRLDLVTVQTQAHGQRFAALGVDAEKIVVTGSIKFDASLAADNEEKLALARTVTGGRPVLLAASTHDGEESLLFDCMPGLLKAVPDLLLVLAPRHTYRADRLEQNCRVLGYRAQWFSRLQENPKRVSGNVLMIDVMGELDAFFELAKVAFIGGSLVPVGGHNLLEAVRVGTPVVMGCHLDNIEDIAQQFLNRDAMIRVQDQAGLESALLELLTDEALAASTSQAAKDVFNENAGALDRVEKLIEGLLDN
jgi:3-deoxy-D-manno-octulosonic-acid transferase